MLVEAGVGNGSATRSRECRLVAELDRQGPHREWRRRTAHGL